MKYTISYEHRMFFQDHHLIEFEGIFSEKNLEALNREVAPLFLNPKETFRDLWRRNEIIKRTVFQKQFAQIANELTQVEPLRICFDQLLKIDEPVTIEGTLEELFCYQEFACGLLIRLDGNTNEKDQIFPKQKGNGLFFSPDFSLSSKNASGVFLLIGYGGKHSRYVFNQNDPNVYQNKSLGYTYGSHLNHRHHPTVFR